jgi:hypothetical protein
VVRRGRVSNVGRHSPEAELGRGGGRGKGKRPGGTPTRLAEPRGSRGLATDLHSPVVNAWVNVMAPSLERLSALPDGRLAYRMKRASPTGTTHLVLAPVAFLRPGGRARPAPQGQPASATSGSSPPTPGCVPAWCPRLLPLPRFRAPTLKHSCSPTGRPSSPRRMPPSAAHSPGTSERCLRLWKAENQLPQSIAGPAFWASKWLSNRLGNAPRDMLPDRAHCRAVSRAECWANSSSRRQACRVLPPSPTPFRLQHGSPPAFPAHALATMKLRA